MNNKKYKVGYKKPPKHSQFKRGKSGNPKGRPKRKKESMSDLIGKLFNKTIKVSVNGDIKTITQAEAFLSQLYKKAIEGHGPSIKIMSDFYRNYMTLDHKVKIDETKPKKYEFADAIEASKYYRSIMRELEHD